MKYENLLLLNSLKIKYVEFKKCALHIKLTVYYTAGFTCKIHLLNSTYFIFNQFKSNKVSRLFCYWIYLLCSVHCGSPWDKVQIYSDLYEQCNPAHRNDVY